MKVNEVMAIMIIVTVDILCCYGEWGGSKPVVYTVYNVAKTWNEAKSICHANNNTMLRMADNTVWEFWIKMLNLTSTVPHRTNSQFWFGLHFTSSTYSTSNLYWDNCIPPAWVQYGTYQPKEKCFGFDVHFKPFSTVLVETWKDLPCTDQNEFICTWENDCIYQTCEEYLILLSEAECSTACTTLFGLGEVTDQGNCRSRYLQFVNSTACNVYKLPGTETNGDYFSICYKPAIDTPLTHCTNTPPTLDLSTFSDASVTPNSTCPVTATTTQHSTATTASTGTCQCPCNALDQSTKQPMTIEQKIENIKKELTIDAKETSNSKRKLISVSDDRPSAKTLGVFGLVILIIVPVLIVLMDLSSMSRHFNYFCSKKTVLRYKGDNKQANSTRSNIFSAAKNRMKSPFAQRTLSTEEILPSDNKKEHIPNSLNNTEDNGNRHCSDPTSERDKRQPSKCSRHPKVHVIFKDILDAKYQSSMIASRVHSNEVKSGKRPVNEENVYTKSDDIEEPRRGKSAKAKTYENMPWLHIM